MLLALRILGCSFLCIIFLIGLTGNAIVCSVIRNGWNRTSATNIILLNLAIADILGCLVNMPIMFITFIVDFDDALLEDLSDAHFVLTVVIGLAICLCHLLLCMDRYDAIIWPFRRRITKPRMKKISAAIWAASIGMGVVASTLVVTVPTHWLILHDDEPHYLAGEILNSVGTIVIIATLAVMLYSFVKVKQGIKAHDRNMSTALGKSALDKEMQLTKVAAVLVTGFTITCLPWVFMRLVYSITGHQNTAGYVVSYCLLYMSHAINPLVYAGLMKRFQKAMRISARNLFSRLSCNELEEQVSDLVGLAVSREPQGARSSLSGRRPSCIAVHPIGSQEDGSINVRRASAPAFPSRLTALKVEAFNIDSLEQSGC